MPDYSNFYGGREGLSFPLTKTFKSIDEMVKAFKLGDKYTEVNYDEYVFIDTGDISDTDNGKLFRRGYKQDAQGGAIYIGQVVGQKGTGFIVAKNYSPDTIPQVATRTGAEAYFNVLYPNGYQDSDGIHTGYLLTTGYFLGDKDYYFFNFGKTETGEYEGWTYLGTTHAPYMIAGDVTDSKTQQKIRKATEDTIWLITEKEDDLVKLVITKKPRTVYQVNEKFDPTGMEVVVYHEDGSQEIVTDYYISGYDSSYAHIGDIKIIYHSLSASLTVEIQDDIKEIKVTHMPYKTEYYVGEEFNADGLEVTAYTSSGNNYPVDDYLLSGFSSAIAGTSTITVSFSGKQTTFNVTIIDIINNIYIDKLPTKIDYNIGDEFDPSGIVVNGIYKSGTIKPLNIQDLSFSGFDSATEGTKTITVTHTPSKKTTTFEVRVNMPIEKIMITKRPNKLDYNLNEKFDPTGIQVTAYYFDGRTFDVTDRVTYSGFDSTSPGEKTITVQYLSFTDRFNITVKDIMLSIYVKDMPTKTTYQQGENFDSTGLIVNGIWASGEETNVTNDCNLSGFDSSKVGTCTITVKYQTFTTNFNVTIEQKKQVWIEASIRKGEGSIVPSGVSYYNIGSSATYKARPAKGYQNDGLFVDGSYKSGSTYTFTNLQINHYIDAQFVVQKGVWEVNISSVGGGNVYPKGNQRCVEGIGITVTAKPLSGHAISYWELNGEVVQRGGLTYNIPSQPPSTKSTCIAYFS